MNKWNGKRFSIYDKEEKQVLGLLNNLGEQTNFNTDEIERLTISDNKKVSHEEMKSKYKMDENADFTGSWYGIKRPTQSDEGLASTVEQIIDETIPNINSQLEQINNLKVDKTEFNKIETGNWIEEYRRKNNNRLIAHRGAMALFPENTLISLEQASAMGFFGVETDIFLSKDNQWIIMHDETIDRTTNGTGAISSYTKDELKQFVIDSGTNITLYPNLKIPTLDEYLQIARNYNSFPCLEIKGGNEEGYNNLLQLLLKYNMTESVMFVSFIPSALEEIRKRDKNIPLVFNSNLSYESINWCIKNKPSIISTPNGFVTYELVKYAHDNGVYVLSYSINNYHDMQNQMALGVDLFTTDGKIL